MFTCSRSVRLARSRAVRQEKKHVLPASIIPRGVVSPRKGCDRGRPTATQPPVACVAAEERPKFRRSGRWLKLSPLWNGARNVHADAAKPLPATWVTPLVKLAAPLPEYVLGHIVPPQILGFDVAEHGGD